MCMPLTVTSKEEYDKLIAPNKLYVPITSPAPSDIPVSPRAKKEEPIVEVTFPQNYGFSILVPQFFDHVRKFVADFFQFATDLTDTDQYIIRSTDMLIKALSQIIINTMEHVCI